MSAWVLAWAWRQHGLSDGAHLLLCYLADQADDGGVIGLHAPVTREALAALFDRSVDTVDRRVGELEAAGRMAVERRRRPAPAGGVVSISNVYRIASPAPPGRQSAPAPIQGRNPAALDDAEAQIQGRTSAANPQDCGPGHSRSPAANPQDCGPGTRRIAALDEARASGVYILDEPQEKATRPEPKSRAATVAAYTEDPLPSSTTTTSVWPEVGSPVIPRHTISRQADWLLHVVNSPLLDAAKSAGLISGAFTVDRWVSAGADLEQVVLPVMMAEVSRRQKSGKGSIRSWNMLTEDVRAAAVRHLTPLESFAALAAEAKKNGDGIGGGRGESEVVAGAGRANGGEPRGMLGAAVRYARKGG